MVRIVSAVILYTRITIDGTGRWENLAPYDGCKSGSRSSLYFVDEPIYFCEALRVDEEMYNNN